MDKENFENLLFSGFTREEINYLINLVSHTNYFDKNLSVCENSRIVFKIQSYLLSIECLSKLVIDLGDEIYAKKNS